MPAQLLLVNPGTPRSRLRRPNAEPFSSMHRPVMRSGVRLPKPVDVPSSPRSNGEEKMAKKKQKSRGRRAASPAQIAARKKFVEMVRSGKFGKKKKAKKAAKKKASAKKRAVKKAAHKVARKHRDNPGHKAKRRHAKRRKHRDNPARKHKRRHAKKHMKARANPARKHKRRRSRRARHNPLHGFMRMNARGPSKRALAQQAEGAALEGMMQGIKEQRAGEKLPKSRFRRGAKFAAMSPQEKRAYMRRAKARKKNKKKIAAVRASIKKVGSAMKKAPKGSRKRILRARKSALSLHRSFLTGQITGADRRMLDASGLMKVRNNPSFGEVFASLKMLAPQIGAHAAGLAGAAYVGQMAGDKLSGMVPSWMPGREFISKHAVTISTVGAAIAAYEALKHMSPKTRPFAGAALMGGMAAAFVHAAARMQTKSGTLGRDIGLPLGLPAAAAPAPAAPAAPVAGFVDIGGRALAVDGVGEYMSLAGNTLTGSSLGDYMSLSGSTLTGSSLGEIGQMSEGRQGARALNSPGDVPVEDFLGDEEEDEGSLSGSIFDD